jgi:putative NADH-flavin reductase
MKVAVFGATGDTGRPLVRQALDDGHDVTVLVRDAGRLDADVRDRLRVVVGDVAGAAAVSEALRGREAAVSVLGPAKGSTPEALTRGTENILAAMREHGVRRFVTLLGAGVVLPEDEQTLGGRLASGLVRLLNGRDLREKERQIALLRASDVEWVAVRPPRLVNGPRTGRYRTGTLRLSMANKVARADVADFVLRTLTDDRWVRQAPMVSA